MAKQDIIPYQMNVAFKRAFVQLQLDLEAVMEFTPFDLDLENRRLQNLLDFVRRYQRQGDRQTMELIEGDFLFPPIFPGISPENDWYRFEQWMQGKPVRQKLSAMLPPDGVFPKPEQMDDDELDAALNRLETALAQAGYSVGLHPDLPKRLAYTYLYKLLDEIFEMDEPGGMGWCIDGCGGYCPGCIQRPWCSTGESSCWPEDEAVGKMHFIHELNEYLSASPQSLQILQRLQASEDAEFERFKAEDHLADSRDLEAYPGWKAKLN